MDKDGIHWIVYQLECKREQYKKIVKLIDERLEKLYQISADKEFLAKAASNKKT